MPPNTAKVDRTTQWGNPFVVGKHGTHAECVGLFTKLMAGYVCMSTDNVSEQLAYRVTAEQKRGSLVGRNLACWCPLNKPCHADALLMVASGKRHNVGAKAQPTVGRLARGLENSERPGLGKDGTPLVVASSAKG